MTSTRYKNTIFFLYQQYTASEDNHTFQDSEPYLQAIFKQANLQGAKAEAKFTLIMPKIAIKRKQ